MLDPLKLLDVRSAMPSHFLNCSWNALQLPGDRMLLSEGSRCEGLMQGSPVMMDPLKLRDMRIPINMRPAMPSHVLAFCILESPHEKLMEAGGRVVFTIPSTTVHTLSASSMTYTDSCIAGMHARRHICSHFQRHTPTREVSVGHIHQSEVD